jgi:hypothetical protein
MVRTGSVVKKAIIRRIHRVSLVLFAALLLVSALGMVPAQASPPPGSGEWDVQWSDEFTANGLDTSKWNPAWAAGYDISGECPSSEMVKQPGDGYL